MVNTNFQAFRNIIIIKIVLIVSLFITMYIIHCEEQKVQNNPIETLTKY